MMPRKTFCKTLLICFSLLLAATLMFACAPLLESEYGSIASDGEVTMRTQYAAYAKDVDEIQVIIHNGSGEEIGFGAAWTMEKLDGGTWMMLPFKPDTAWNELLYLLSDGGTRTFTVHIDSLDYKLTDGTYRIVKEIDGVPVAAEFTVGESNITAESPYGYAALESLQDSYSREDALADGVVMLDGDTEYAVIDKFFADIRNGASAQLRYGEIIEGRLTLTDIITEFKLGERRILRRRMEVGGEIDERYYSSFAVENDGIYLGNTAHSTDASLLSGITWYGRDAVIEQITEYNAARSSYAVNTAAYWSDNGMRLITLRDSSLEFGCSELYENGGNAGSVTSLPSDIGMTAIREAVWTDADTVMFICDSGVDGMTGYVFYDTAEHKVTSYTSSFYGYIVDEDGKITIPE